MMSSVGMCGDCGVECFCFGVVLIGGGAFGDEVFDVGFADELLDGFEVGWRWPGRGCGHDLGGFLLGEAVEGAEAPDEVDGVDADDLAGGEAGGDDVEGEAVVGVVEGGDEDEAVGDVEVGVAGGEALAFEEDG